MTYNSHTVWCLDMTIPHQCLHHYHWWGKKVVFGLRAVPEGCICCCVKELTFSMLALDWIGKSLLSPYSNSFCNSSRLKLKEYITLLFTELATSPIAFFENPPANMTNNFKNLFDLNLWGKKISSLTAGVKTLHGEGNDGLPKLPWTSEWLWLYENVSDH